MTAPLDSRIEAEFDPTLEQVAAVNVALPPAGTRTTVPQPAGDSARVNLGAGTEFGQVCVFRQGDSLMVTAQGYGQLVISNTPANGPNPPEVADTHGQVVRAESIGAGCGTPGAGIAPAGGGNPAALAAIAPAAGPGAPGGGEASGGHFNSTFDPALFPGLNYGPVDPLAFNRGPPIFDPGPGLINVNEPAFDSLDMRSNSADAGIPFNPATTPWTPTGPELDPAAIFANEGNSIYNTPAFALLVGPPLLENVTTHAPAEMTISFVREDAGFQNMVGYYTFDDGGNINGAKFLWLNATEGGGGAGTVAADFLGKTGDGTIFVTLADPTHVGFFLVQDGGGSTFTDHGTNNLPLFTDMFHSLGLTDPAIAALTWQQSMDLINEHIRVGAGHHIEIDTTANDLGDTAGWKALDGDTFYSHNNAFNTDFGATGSALTGNENAHVISGPNPTGDRLEVGFEDLSFRGTVNSDANGPQTIDPSENPFAVDFDFNDTILTVQFSYPEIEIGPGHWSPLTAIDNALNNNLGSITQVQFVVAGLDADVSLVLTSPLSAGWTLNTAVDGSGNGTYTLLPPGADASSAAFVAELAKLEVDVSSSTSNAHPTVTIDFTATDSAGLTDSSHSTLSFHNAGDTPPAPPHVDVSEGPLPPPSPTIEQLITP